MSKAVCQTQDSVYSSSAIETPDAIAAFFSASFRGAGMVPFSLPCDSLPCQLPALSSRSHFHCWVQEPKALPCSNALEQFCVQTVPQKEAGLWQTGGFFSFPSVQINPVPQKAISAFKTKGKSHVLYRPKLEYWILSHMQIILSPGIKSTSKHVPINTH